MNNHLFVGYRFNSNISVVDTSGGTYSSIATLPLTNDIGTTVSGCYGLSVNPADGSMYILYQDSGGNMNRRLGVVDTTTGAITDIGNAGNMTDIAFNIDGTCYGNSGSPDGYSLYEVNISDASSTFLNTFSSTTLSTGICYDQWGDRLFRSQQQSGIFWEVEVTGYTESNLAFGSHPGWINALTMVDEDRFLAAGGSGLFMVDISTSSWTGVPFSPLSTMHAITFGTNGLATIINGPNTFCLNEPTPLTITESGTSYQWLLDDAPIAGETDSVHYPTASGMYSCILDGTDTSIAVSITVLPIPTADFTMDPNPMDLAVTTSGTVDFTNTSTDAEAYFWDFDNGITTTLMDPSLSFLDVGDYNIMLVAIDTTTGCSDTAYQTLTVINSVGISELSTEFKVYPVPTTDVVNISTNGIENDYIVELRDLNGRLISQQKAGMASTVISFDLSDFESGVYFINIFNENEQGHFKVIKK